MDARFLVDGRGALVPPEGQPSPLTGRSGYFRLQPSTPDLVVMLRSPPQGGVAQLKPRVVLAGDCGAFPLADLIAFLGQSRWSGVLRVSATTGERSLLLKEGDVRSAASDSSTDRIGEVMVRLGYVSRADLDKVLAEAPPSRIGRALIERGLVKSHDLYKCLNEQIAEIFHGIMLSKEGAFCLIDQDVDERSLTHNLSLSVNGLLMDSIRKIDELAQFRKRIAHANLYVLHRKPPEEPLEKEEEAVLAHVDGQRTIVEVGRLARISEFDATRIVHRLLELRVVQVSESPNQPPMSSVSSIAAPPPPEKKPEPAAPAKPAPLTPGQIITVFNAIFGEVRNEVAKGETLEPFLIAANAALKGSGVSTSPLVTGLGFGDDGLLPADTLAARFDQLQRDGQLGAEPLLSLRQALSDVMFFLLFQAGELLESAADEQLAKRVKEHLATLDPK